MEPNYTVTKKGHKLPFWSVVDDYAYALGKLSMAWSALDHDLQETFQWLVGTDEKTAAIITTGLERVEARAAPIRKLVVSQDIQPELADFVGALMNRITKGWQKLIAEPLSRRPNPISQRHCSSTPPRSSKSQKSIA